MPRCLVRLKPGRRRCSQRLEKHHTAGPSITSSLVLLLLEPGADLTTKRIAGRRRIYGDTTQDRTVRPGRRGDAPDDLLHVRLPLRHQRASESGRGRQAEGPLHRGQPRSPGEQGCALCQGICRHHAALFAGTARTAAAADRAARIRRVQEDFLGRSADTRLPTGWSRCARSRKNSPSSPAATSRNR